MNLEDEIAEDISVIVQGKIFGNPGDPYKEQLTLQCLESIKKHLPQAEIVLSTWEGSEVKHLFYDRLIFNRDPGAISYSLHQPNFLNNNNRQIVSTYNGLKEGTKKYGIKMRGDCRLVNTFFVNFFQNFPRCSTTSFFKNRIVIPTIYSRNPRRIAQLIHPSDIFQFGLLEDLKSLWGIPLQPEPTTTRAIPLERRILNSNLDGRYFRMKFGAEQYIWYSFLKKQGVDLELKYYCNIPINKIVKSEQSIINNFVIVEPDKLGVILPERMQQDANLYTFSEWEKLSKIYAAGTSKLFQIQLIWTVYQNNVISIVKKGLRKFCS